MPFQIKQCYTAPEQLYDDCDENGRPIRSRIIGHPVRPARRFELETWWSDIDPASVPAALLAGHSVRQIEGEPQKPDGQCGHAGRRMDAK